jgi:hypothetical protein
MCLVVEFLVRMNCQEKEAPAATSPQQQDDNNDHQYGAEAPAERTKAVWKHKFL